MKTKKANEGMWLTQATIEDNEVRLFSDALYMPDDADDAAWVEWTDAEKVAYEAEISEKRESEEREREAERERELAERDAALQEDGDTPSDEGDKRGLSQEERMQQRLQRAKRRKVSEIKRYDTSDAVNSFTFNGESAWFDKDTRMGLLTRMEAEGSVGKADTTLWVNGKGYDMPGAKCGDLVRKLEVYAAACFDATSRNVANVEALETIEEVNGYNYKASYPAKLAFEF